MTRPIPVPATVRLKGVQSYQEAVQSLRGGESLVFTWQPNNVYDPNAVAVSLTGTGQTIGYIPKTMSDRWAVTLAGGNGTGTVTNVVGENELRGVTVRLEEVTVNNTGACDAGAAEQNNTAGDRRVRTKSGRVLGSVARIGNSRVTVRKANGSEVDYPLELVEISSGTLRSDAEKASLSQSRR